MKPVVKKWLKTFVRWGIAIAGVWYIVANISLYDRVMIADAKDGRPMPVRLIENASESDPTYTVEMPDRSRREVAHDELLVKCELDKAVIKDGDGVEQRVEVLGLKVISGVPQDQWPLIVGKPRNILMRFLGKTHGDQVRIVPTSQVVGGYALRVPYPLIERGLAGMTLRAFDRHPYYLLAAIFIFPSVFFIVAYRWRRLMQAFEINVTMRRAFALSMVGAFYNTFMPGSTGGDLLKAYYAAKQTPHRTRAVLSVLIDRIIGLLALVILGGAAASYQYLTSTEMDDATVQCGRVALGSVIIIGGTLLGLIVFYQRTVRRMVRLDLLLSKLPMQTQVQKAVGAMELYRQTPWLPVWAVLITLPVHATVVISATFAGMAFELPLKWQYYWVVVPVVVLAGAIPISPQGAGVMEFFAWILTRRQGCTMGHVLALTMSIRLVQILWNLTGVVFVLRGGYHAPSKAQQQELDSDGTVSVPTSVS